LNGQQGAEESGRVHHLGHDQYSIATVEPICKHPYQPAVLNERAMGVCYTLGRAVVPDVYRIAEG
jgi:hypothetical protein